MKIKNENENENSHLDKKEILETCLCVWMYDHS